MTNEQILKKAIEKAIKNGWDISHGKFWFRQDDGNIIYDLLGKADVYLIIFSHDFAKAFWGEGYYFILECEQKNDVQWKQHLMNMVLEKDPILYLAKFL